MTDRFTEGAGSHTRLDLRRELESRLSARDYNLRMRPRSVFTLFAGALAMGIFGSLAGRTAPEPLKVGDPAPEAASVDQDGKPVTLSRLYGTGWTLVYFYPKADTPGCTAEACSLRDAFADLTKKGVTVVGVSADKPDSQKAFKEKYRLPFTLLADSDKRVIDAFGVPTTLGFASRQSFLIKDGKIVWRDLHASTKEQAADILKVVATK